MAARPEHFASLSGSANTTVKECGRKQVFKRMVGIRGNIGLIEFKNFAPVKDHLDFALRGLSAHHRQHVLDAPLRYHMLFQREVRVVDDVRQTIAAAPVV